MSLRLLALTAAVMSSFVVVAGCGATKPACSASTCTGCCDAAGACQAGGTTFACGANGTACVSCSAAEVCASGGCISLNGGGGGSTGGGGGGATGGGGGGATGGGGGGATGGGGGSATLAPNVLLVLDTSGSMLTPIDTSASPCPPGCGAGNPCPSNCPTRLSETQQGLTAWLSQHGSAMRVGLVRYPTDASCGAPTSSVVPLPAPAASDDASAWAQNAMAVSSAVASITPVGGTPTSAALGFAASLPGLRDAADGRNDVVVLLTDGLPNCNATNPNNQCTSPNAACQCTLSTCAATTVCSIGCLDDVQATQAVSALAAQGTKVAIVGIGADVSTGSALAVLSAMADQGGLVRACPSGSSTECGTGDTCDAATHTCGRSFFEAPTAAALQGSLDAIFQRVAP